MSPSPTCPSSRLAPYAAATLLALAACSGGKLATYEYPSPVDTSMREVLLLDEQRFTTPSGVTASSDFPGARLAGFRESGTDEATGLPRYTAEIPAENAPINPSPWYAMALTAETPGEVIVRLAYPAGTRNRYQPKTAAAPGGPWAYVAQDRVDTAGRFADVRLELGRRPLYLAAQELIATDSVRRWITGLPLVDVDTVGESWLGRPIWKLELTRGKRDERPAVVFLSRQHPPEVTGFQAFQAFFARLLEDDALARGFRDRYRVVAFPVVNPDGVDEGHWRHNAGGVDLNRDWADYRQPEVRAVAGWLQRALAPHQVVWGMDFHSTQYDVLYTHDPARVAFRGADTLRAWTDALAAWAAETYAGASGRPTENRLGRPVVTGQDTLRIEPDAIGRPTSASWFAQHFGAVGVTYEVADEQDRAYIRAKARRAAEELMRRLVE